MLNKTIVSNRLLHVPPSPIRKLVPLAVQAKKDGVKVYHLNIGDPDIQTPEVMINVLKHWNKNPVGYSNSQGEPQFLEALVWYYHKQGFPFIETKNIQVTVGGSEAISWALFACCNPGDEVIVFEPFYANYHSYAVVNGVRLAPVPTKIDNGFHLPGKHEIENKITSKTKAILICNPNNPTGTVYTTEEIDMLVSLAQAHNLFLLSDEVYREYAYDGRKQISLLNYMPQSPDRVIVLDSMSKRYSLCGVRLGALISLNQAIVDGALRIAQGRLSAGLIDQLVAAKLTEVPDSYFQRVHDEYEKRRNILYAELKKIPGVTLVKPEGAFYAIVGLPVDDAEKFCQWLLTAFRNDNETIMLAPAAGFYATPGLGKNEVRIAYVLNTADLYRGIELLSLALQQYKK